MSAQLDDGGGSTAARVRVRIRLWGRPERRQAGESSSPPHRLVQAARRGTARAVSGCGGHAGAGAGADAFRVPSAARRRAAEKERKGRGLAQRALRCGEQTGTAAEGAPARTTAQACVGDGRAQERPHAQYARAFGRDSYGPAASIAAEASGGRQRRCADHARRDRQGRAPTNKQTHKQTNRRGRGAINRSGRRGPLRSSAAETPRLQRSAPPPSGDVGQLPPRARFARVRARMCVRACACVRVRVCVRACVGVRV